MKALQFAVSLAATLLALSTVAQAKPKLPGGLTHRIQNMTANAPKATTRAKAKRSECVNLSGNWKGSCVGSDDDQYNDDFTIEQSDCDSLDFGYFSVSIGGAEDIGSTSTSFLYRGTAFPDWNAAGTVLRMKVSLAGRQLGDDSFFMNIRADSDYQLVNGQLITRTIQDSTQDYGGQHSEAKTWETCTYDKLPDAR